MPALLIRAVEPSGVRVEFGPPLGLLRGVRHIQCSGACRAAGAGDVGDESGQPYFAHVIRVDAITMRGEELGRSPYLYRPPDR